VRRRVTACRISRVPSFVELELAASAAWFLIPGRASADTDGGGMTDSAECLADENTRGRWFLSPCMHVSTSVLGGAEVEARFGDEKEGSRDMLCGFAPIATGVRADPPHNTYTDTVARSAQVFYRLRLVSIVTE